MKIALIVISCIVAALLVAFVVWRIVRRRRQIKKIEAETGEKVPRRTFKEWWRDHKPSKRRLIQVYATLLYNANLKGYITGNIYTSPTTKYVCVPGLNCYSCPGAVGACPLGAFQNALAESSVRAPYYVIGILAIYGLMFARTVCGFLCPIGFGQELLYKIRTPKLKKNRVTRVLSYFKYVLLAVLVIIFPLAYALRDIPLPAFCKYICPAGTIGGAIGLLINPNNAAMFGMLGGQFTWKFSLLVVFIVASIFIFRFFCRFFCPLGAIYGFFNRLALIGVKVDKNNCIDCDKCVSVCKMDVKRVGDHECINCGECISACPTKAISWKGPKILLHQAAVEEAPSVQAVDAVAEIEGAAGAVEAAETGAQPKTRKKRPAAFWVQLTAFILAIALLVGALVYYNFIDVPRESSPPVDPPPITDDNPPDDPSVTVGYEVGNRAPNFTVSLYGADGNFTLYDKRGKVTVINFWATWCTPCVQEIPYFDQLAKEREDLHVVAIHGSSTRDVMEFIEGKWPDYSLTFAQDNLDGSNCLTYLSLGGSGTWPMTVIVDEEGIVLYNSTQSFKDYAQLSALISQLTESTEAE